MRNKNAMSPDEILDEIIADLDDEQAVHVATSDKAIDRLWQAVKDSLMEPLDPME